MLIKISYRNASFEDVPVLIEFDKPKPIVIAETKYLEDITKYVRVLLEDLSEQATLEFQYDDKTASQLRNLIRDSKTKVS